MTFSGFHLTDGDKKKIDEWLETIKPDILKAQGIPDPLGEDEPYYGAAGGGLEYIFSPNGLGMCLRVREHWTKLELDLTDYDAW